jgi:hypothetical protein
MQINYAGRVSKDDFWRALSLHNMQQYRVYRWIMFGGGVLLALWGIYLTIQDSLESDEAIRYAYFGALILLVAMTLPMWNSFLQWSSYNQKGNLYRNNVFGLIDDTGITINGPDVSMSFRWSAYDNYRDSKDILMLYQGKNHFDLFTPSMFSNQEEWEKFVSFAKGKVSSSTKSA